LDAAHRWIPFRPGVSAPGRAHTAIGAQVYFWARVAYLPVYVVGIPYLRTAVWAASLWGILQLVEPLLR
jgi:uncharacterized MAPEG superfamily protein